ncbi:MAG: ATP-dependent DNA helicase RecG [Clostridia bacterium]|nr:ATP-dependent DNA helicase RecG [Clostridia bacterium]
MDLHTDVKYIPGVGPKRAEKLAKLGIGSVGSLLDHLPSRYEDWTHPLEPADVAADEVCCVRATALDKPVLKQTKSRDIYVCTLYGGDTTCDAIFFSEYAANGIVPGREYVLYGKAAKDFRGGLQFWSPKFFPAAQAPKLVPVYPMTAGVTSSQINSYVKKALDGVGELPEFLPQELIDRYKLPGRAEAYRMAHFPRDPDEPEYAGRRFMYSELYLFMLAVSLEGRDNRPETDNVVRRDLTGEFLGMLPFSPTGAQRRAVAQIARDMGSGVTMRRMLQGDVGSGKTAVAAAAIYSACKNGFQCAVLAPTEVLARQHLQTFIRFFAGCGISVELLVGAQTPAKKRDVRSRLASGGIDLIIGTHALLTDGTEFSELGLVVTDEQHRFGVAQRAKLLSRGRGVHSLVMSATPIPRTLALMLYGDLDRSVLDELPAGRTPVRTYALGAGYEARFLAFIKKHCLAGEQAYVVCPAIEETEDGPVSAVATFERLRKNELAGLDVGLLHGEMKAAEKNSVFSRFTAGEIQVLVSTVVIEVGVDVPNATTMLIYDADRFGLAQLHQLRGRIGRGREESHCAMLTRSEDPAALERLKVLENSSDGFEIAEYDFRDRGPGEFFGERQSGMPKLRRADLLRDAGAIEQARRDAEELIKSDPSLEKHPLLLREVERAIRGFEAT